MRDYSDRYKRLLDKLIEARTQAGMKQTDVAEKLGKPQSYISKLESGERKIAFTELEDLGRVYQVPINFFETTEEELEKD